MCKALKFPKSAYYKALLPIPSNKEQEYQKFSAEVKQCFDKNKRHYGAVKIHWKLNDGGIPCSIKRMLRHIQCQELRSVIVKQYNHKANQGKVTDIIYIMLCNKDGPIWHLLWIFMTVKSSDMPMAGI